MKKLEFGNWWHRFLGWKGWRVCGDFFGKLWNRTVCWKGWKTIFFLPFPLVLMLSAVCCAGLVWVFANGLETWVPAYFLYALSAWCLGALLFRTPLAVRGAKKWMSGHPKTAAFLENQELKFMLGLYAEQVVNFSYGTFKITSGIVLGSAWIGCDGIYNMAQALIQLFQILRRKHTGSLARQWRSYRLCGGLILLMHLTLIGIVFQTVNWNRVEEQGQIMVIATAAFTFYKITRSFVSIAKDRKHEHPVDSSIRMLNLAQAMFSVFVLQASMIHVFGTGDSWEHWLNLGTGCVVCLLIVSMGIYMIRRGNREIKSLQENGHG